MLIFNDTEEKAVEKAIAALADMIPLEAMQPPHSPALTFPGLEIKLHQRRVLKTAQTFPHPFRVRRTLLPCRQSGEGIHKGANL